jgi:hypothetical protein
LGCDNPPQGEGQETVVVQTYLQQEKEENEVVADRNKTQVEGPKVKPLNDEHKETLLALSLLFFLIIAIGMTIIFLARMTKPLKSWSGIEPHGPRTSPNMDN